MSGSIEGKIAIVTGGSHGYGIGIAEKFIAEGTKVYITARSEDRLNEVAKHIGATAIVADVTSAADWDRVFKTVCDADGKVDILVNNAGAGVMIAPLAEQADDVIEKSIAVNLTGAILGCKRAATLMTKQKSGTIVNISSVCAIEAWEGWGVYSAAKAGLQQFTRCLYCELRPHGARATCLTPSWGKTDFLASMNMAGHDADTAAKCIQPEQIGKVVADICALPDHLVMQEVTLLPLVQEISPL